MVEWLDQTLEVSMRAVVMSRLDPVALVSLSERSASVTAWCWSIGELLLSHIECCEALVRMDGFVLQSPGPYGLAQADLALDAGMRWR